MPELTVIEGGGERDDWRRKGWLRHRIAEAMIESLRSMARGHDEKSKAGDAMWKAIGEVLENEVTLVEFRQIWNEEMRAIHAELEPRSEYGDDGPHDDENEIIKCSLRVMAEGRCGDSGAGGRTSSRRWKLWESIERMQENRLRRYDQSEVRSEAELLARLKELLPPKKGRNRKKDDEIIL